MQNEDVKDFLFKVEGEELFSIIRGYSKAQFLYQAFSCRVFEYLTDKPKSIEEISKTMGCNIDRLIFLLDALTSINMVQKKEELYSLSPVSATYLCKNSEFYIGDLFELEFTNKQRDDWENLEAWLKGYFSNEGHNPKEVFKPSFIKAMAQGVLIDSSIGKTVELISNHACFKSAEKLLDVGGGHGLFPIALQKKKPKLKVAVFDLPQVEPVTRDYANKYNAKIDFIAGNFYENDFPLGQDIVLTFDILHPVPTTKKEEVFKKAYNCLNKNGYLFYKLWFLDSTRTKPDNAAIFALKCKIMNDQSHVYTLNEAEEMLTGIGFNVEGSFSVGDNGSTILIARKK
ncbi:class I SAM-dependent methyltransferase [Anaerovorax odorimutans]|uniref:class I SAM-dependent methyltransferase n=1 Tax=Anaerovorax odorimutans TaxID=109327 RepID=UPI0004298E92|nr:class I SAM-dependent methyltransferase [Anaerovorax odorimutans]